MENYTFTIQIIEPQELQNSSETSIFTHSAIEKKELHLVSKFIESMTQKGRLVKIRIGILEDGVKITSIMMNTKNLTSSSVIDFLTFRVTDKKVVRYLSEEEESSPYASSQNPDQQKKKDEEEEVIHSEQKTIDETNPTPKTATPRLPKIDLKKESAAKKKIKPFVRIMMVCFMVFILGIGMLTVQLIQTLSKEMVRLETKIKNLEQNKEVMEEKPKVEVFSRYFLSTLYAENLEEETYQEKLKAYTGNLDVTDWKPLNKTLRNNMLYEIKSNDKKNEYSVTYIINYDTVEAKGNTEKVTFVIESTKGSQVVKKKPVFGKFSVGNN